MTVLAVTAFSGPFTPDGVVTAFPFTFVAASKSEVSVIRRSSSGDAVLSGYTVTLNYNNTGTVKFTSPPAVGDPIYILSAPSFQNQVTFANQSSWSPTAMNAELDRVAVRDIFLKDTTSRAIAAPPGEVIALLPNAAARAGKFFGFDTNGNPVPLSGSGADGALRTDLLTQGTALVTWLPAVGLTAMNLQTALRLGLPLMLEHFGGAGDNGVTDNYPALKALVAQVNTLGTATIAFAPGKTYHINQYVTAVNGNAITDVLFSQINGLTFIGNGAKLDYRGNFDRNLSTTFGLPGLYMYRCTNVRIVGLELDGNADASTNSSGSTESFGATGIILNSCNDVVLDSVYAHHFQTDGFGIRAAASWDGAKTYNCQRVIMRNCRGEHNARQGLTIEAGRNIVVQGGSLSFNGYTQGSYAAHSPCTGCDTEPNYGPASAAPNTRDDNTGDILFDNVRIEGNLGGTFKAVGNNTAPQGETTDHVTIRSCQLISDDTTAQEDFILGVRDSHVHDCTFDINGNNLRLTYGVDPNVTIDFYRNVVRGRGNLLMMLHEVGNVSIDRNQFIVEPSGAFTGKVWNFTISNVIFERNRIYVPQAAYTNQGAGNYDVIFSSGTGTPTYRNNRYVTDLPANSGGATTAHFAQSYPANAIVYDEVYAGVSPGVTSTFRPIFNSSFDTTGHFNRNHRTANAPGSKKPGNAAYSFVATQSPSLVIYDTAITANRAVSLDTTAGFIFRGARAKILRLAAATGAFTVDVGTGPLKSLAAGQWCEVEYDGTAWTLIAFGSL